MKSHGVDNTTTKQARRLACLCGCQTIQREYESSGHRGFSYGLFELVMAVSGRLLSFVDLAFPPVGRQALQWSNDGKAAVVTEKAVYVLVSKRFALV